MRYLYVLLGLAVLFSVTSAEAGSFSPTIKANTYVDASKANENFSENNTLWVSSADGKPTKEAYLSFLGDQFYSNSATTPDKIKSATLKLSADNVEKPGKITAYFVDGPTFPTVTWSDKPEYDSSISANLTIDKSGEYSIDITPLIKEAVRKCLDCGFSIALVADDSTSIEFSKNAPEKEVLIYNTAD